MSEKQTWTKSQLRTAATIAKELGVTIVLNRDGSVKITPEAPKDHWDMDRPGIPL